MSSSPVAALIDPQPLAAQSGGQHPFPRILVLLAAYNGAAWIGPQLRTILGQRGVNVQVMVRDDGSSDNTRTEISPFSLDGRVTLCPPGPPTGSAAQNFLTLIRATPGDGFDFIALSDQDDLWSSGRLLRAARRLLAGRAAGYSSATVAEWPDGRRAILRQSGAMRAADFLFEGAGQGCTFLLRADFYRRVREFLRAQPQLGRDLHYHDWAIYALARTWNLQWIFDQRPTLRYRQHAGNDTGARSGPGAITRRMRLIRTGWYRRQLAVIGDLCGAAAPSNTTVTAWREILTRRRRLQTAGFCLRMGRRKLLDRAVVVFAALVGWI